MLELFKTPVTDIEGKVHPFGLIIVCTAPDVNVTLWLRSVSVLTEIGKFRAENKGIWKEDEEDLLLIVT